MKNFKKLLLLTLTALTLSSTVLEAQKRKLSETNSQDSENQPSKRSKTNKEKLGEPFTSKINSLTCPNPDCKRKGKPFSSRDVLINHCYQNNICLQCTERNNKLEKFTNAATLINHINDSNLKHRKHHSCKYCNNFCSGHLGNLKNHYKYCKTKKETNSQENESQTSKKKKTKKKKKTDKEKFKCQVSDCQIELTTKASLIRHVATQHNSCYDCQNETFKTKKDLYEHFKNKNHKPILYFCETCRDYINDDEKRLNKHKNQCKVKNNLESENDNPTKNNQSLNNEECPSNLSSLTDTDVNQLAELENPTHQKSDDHDFNNTLIDTDDFQTSYQNTHDITAEYRDSNLNKKRHFICPNPKCKKNGKQFSSKLSLESHCYSNNICLVCTNRNKSLTKFTSQSELIRHIKNSNIKHYKSHICEYCNKFISGNPTNLKKHYKSCDDKKIDDQKNPKDKSDPIKDKKRQKTTPKKIKCLAQNCPMKFHKMSLTRHMITEHNSCFKCSTENDIKTFDTKKSLYEHYKNNNHKPTLYFCEICNKYIIFNKEVFEHHRSTHTQTNILKKHTCKSPNCHYSSTNKPNLVRHTRVKHSGCHECSANNKIKTFKSKKDLYRHFKNNNHKPTLYFCETCRDYINDDEKRLNKHKNQCKVKNNLESENDNPNESDDYLSDESDDNSFRKNYPEEEIENGITTQVSNFTNFLPTHNYSTQNNNSNKTEVNTTTTPPFPNSNTEDSNRAFLINQNNSSNSYLENIADFTSSEINQFSMLLNNSLSELTNSERQTDEIPINNEMVHQDEQIGLQIDDLTNKIATIDPAALEKLASAPEATNQNWLLKNAKQVLEAITQKQPETKPLQASALENKSILPSDVQHNFQNTYSMNYEELINILKDLKPNESNQTNTIVSPLPENEALTVHTNQIIKPINYENNFACPFSPNRKAYKSERQLQFHCWKNHKYCALCNICFSSNEELAQHLDKIHRGKSFYCQYCKMFKAEIKKHRPICSKRFIKQTSSNTAPIYSDATQIPTQQNYNFNSNNPKQLTTTNNSDKIPLQKNVSFRHHTNSEFNQTLNNSPNHNLESLICPDPKCKRNGIPFTRRYDLISHCYHKNICLRCTEKKGHLVQFTSREKLINHIKKSNLEH